MRDRWLWVAAGIGAALALLVAVVFVEVVS